MKRARFGRVVLPRFLLFLTLIAAGFAVTTAVAQDATPTSVLLPYEPRLDLSTLDGEILADGSSTVYPITDEAALRFTELAGGVTITVEFSGTGGGFRAFCDGQTDIQNASRQINDGELAACVASGVQYYVFKVGFDGISVVVNPANDFATCLMVDQLRHLWRPDDPANTWQDLDPNWPDETIELYGPGPDSGTFDYFVEAIIGATGGQDLSRTDYFPSENDLDLVAGVETDENALGYFGYAYYTQDSDKLKLVAVDAGGGCIHPSPATIADGSYRPLSRPLYVYVKAASLQRPEVQEFMRFYVANARQLALDVGYVAGPDHAYTDDQAKIEAAVAGAAAPDGPM